MASSARIEELERKFNENPRRYFAPLANEYRKAGDLEQAIAICRTYVPQQPAHMSGHIVFGQALFEAGEHEEARGVFEAALALDPENLIALRHLGDIARERGELAAARTWYQRVLDADPRNEEVAALLTSLDGPAARDSRSDVPTWAEINPERTLELPPALLETVTREQVVAVPGSAPAAPAPPNPVASPLAQTLQPPPPAVPRPGWPQEAPVLAEDIPGPGLVDVEPLDVAAREPGPTPTPATRGPTPTPKQPMPAVLSVPPAALTPPAPAAMSTQGATGAGPVDEPGAFTGMPSESEPESTGAAAAQAVPPAAGLEPMEFVAPPREPSAELSGASPTGTRSAHDEEPPGVFVTETMAELYLQQGFRDEALSVYRQLLAQNPGDATLRERIEDLERGPRLASEGSTADARHGASKAADVPIGAPTIRAFFARLATRRWNGADLESLSAHETVAPPQASHESAAGRAVVAPSDGMSTHEVATHGAPGQTSEASDARAGADVTPAIAFEGPHAGGVRRDVSHEPSRAPLGGLGPGERSDAHTSREPAAAAAPEGSAADESPPVHGVIAETATIEITHEAAMDPAGELLGAAGGRVIDDFGYAASVSTVGISEYDVASYDAADMSGSFGVIPPPGPHESAVEAHAPSAVESNALQPEPAAPASETPVASEASPREARPDAVEMNGTPPTPVSRKPMQTGSVNVLFPPEPVPAADESAAATLSGAFGGPTQPGATGQPARPAANELSLDAIFRESAPPPPEAPRREASAFSFDQFFTEGHAPGGGGSAPGGAGARAPRDGTPEDTAGDSLSDAEQFSNWLAGLKKK